MEEAKKAAERFRKKHFHSKKGGHRKREGNEQRREKKSFVRSLSLSLAALSFLPPRVGQVRDEFVPPSHGETRGGEESPVRSSAREAERGRVESSMNAVYRVPLSLFLFFCLVLFTLTFFFFPVAIVTKGGEERSRAPAGKKEEKRKKQGQKRRRLPLASLSLLLRTTRGTNRKKWGDAASKKKKRTRRSKRGQNHKPFSSFLSVVRSTRKPLLTPERPPTAPCSPPPSLGRRACPRRQPARAAPASTEPASRCRPSSLPASASSSRRRTRRVRATPRTAATPCPRFVYFVDARNVEELAQRERAKKGGKKQGEGHGGEQAKKRRLRRENMTRSTLVSHISPPLSTNPTPHSAEASRSTAVSPSRPEGSSSDSSVPR